MPVKVPFHFASRRECNRSENMSLTDYIQTLELEEMYKSITKENWIDG